MAQDGNPETQREATDAIRIAPIHELSEREHIDLLRIVRDHATARWLSDGRPWTPDKLLRMREWSARDAALPWRERRYFYWGVIMGGAGVVGIVGLHPALAEFPPDHLQAMTAVAPALRGRGIAVRAVNAMMDVFCEREPSARAIIAIVDAQNEPSLRAVVRMRGFTRRESALRTRGREFIIFEFGGCAPSSERK